MMQICLGVVHPGWSLLCTQIDDRELKALEDTGQTQGQMPRLILVSGVVQVTNSGSFLSSCMFLHPRAVDLHKTDPVRQSLI